MSGNMGIYRAAFRSIEQTEPLAKTKVQTPVVAMGGIKGPGARVGEMVRMVAADVKEVVLDDSGHFVPEERPDAVIDEILALKEQLSQRNSRKLAKCEFLAA